MSRSENFGYDLELWSMTLDMLNLDHYLDQWAIYEVLPLTYDLDIELYSYC